MQLGQYRCKQCELAVVIGLCLFLGLTRRLTIRLSRLARPVVGMLHGIAQGC